MQSKFFLKSTSVVGFIIATIGFLAPLLGIDLGPTGAAEIQTLVSAVLSNVDQIMQAGGTLLMLWGRIKAKQPLTLKLGT
jgi:hypothetical protein